MTPKLAPPQRFSLSRWSRRKLAAARRASEASAVRAAEPPATTATVPAGPAALSGSPKPTPPTPTASELPPVESLTFDSDFAPFFKPEVDETVKRAALKQLFRDPRFNVMDGLDVYIDDYTLSEPIPAEMLEKMVQYRYILNPPQTELTSEGHVVDVPSEPPAPGTTAVAPGVDEKPAQTAAEAASGASAGDVVAPTSAPEAGTAKT